MTDKRNVLQRMYEPQHRYPNFGGLLAKLVVRGFRCHADTVVDVRSPVTAFCGLNGTGKTSLLQLAAAAYSNGDRTYHVSNFFARGALDQPFTANASVEFYYWSEARDTRQLTVSRSASGDRWSG